MALTIDRELFPKLAKSTVKFITEGPLITKLEINHWALSLNRHPYIVFLEDMTNQSGLGVLTGAIAGIKIFSDFGKIKLHGRNKNFAKIQLASPYAKTNQPIARLRFSLDLYREWEKRSAGLSLTTAAYIFQDLVRLNSRWVEKVEGYNKKQIKFNPSRLGFSLPGK